MREFIRRALLKTSRMNPEQMHSLLSLVTEEYEMLDAVIDSLGTGLLVCDSFHILLQVNKAASRILPIELHDWQDRPVWACVRDAEISRFIEETIESEETVMAREFELDSASPRFVNVSVVPLVQKKSVRGTIITVEDITDKKREEVKNRRLESLASLTNLAATVAHEIKNPLGSISIYVQLLRKAVTQAQGALEGKMVEYLNVVDEEIERLNRIVVDFLFAVRPLTFELVPMDVGGLIRSIASFFGEELTRGGIDLRLEVDDSLPSILGDERFLRQMVVNLIKNAMGAMEKGGTLTLSARRKEDVIVLTVEDTGIGIPEAVLGRIFEPYFTTKADGTGLGLTMAYKVVKEHGGDISVQSEAGRGTAFTVTLPVLRRAQRLLEYGEEPR
jgi:PAS domain S-box-containing protein